MSSISEDSEDAPKVPSETSRGSSVSSGLQEEYQELLKYAIVTPKWEPSVVTQQQVSNLPQLRLTEPDHRPLTTIDEYSGGTSRTDEDSAVGSEEQETARRHPDLVQFMLPESQIHPPRPMPSPGRTPYRGAVLSPTPSSGSENTIPRVPISSYLMQNDRNFDSQDVVDDPDMTRMNQQLDQWSAKLKTMVLAELSQMKIAMTESHRLEMHRKQQGHEEQVGKLKDEIDQLKELLRTYETSVERKDQVISNLTRAVQTGHDRIEMSKRLMQWKLRMMDERRQTFTNQLAKKYRERSLALRVWQGWRATVEARWKEKVEKACQKKAEEVCVQLTDDYEAKINSLNEALEDAREEVRNLHEEREKYEETMKKAFMRGVCALNLEAMTMFQEDENQPVPSEVETLAAAVNALTCASDRGQTTGARDHARMKPDYLPPDRMDEGNRHAVRFTQQMPQVRAKTNIVSDKASAGAAMMTKTGKSSIKSGSRYPVNRSRTLSAKVTGSAGVQRTKTRSQSELFTAPPSGVLVERHHPNIQNYKIEQTLSHAVKYPHSPAGTITPQPVQRSTDGSGHMTRLKATK